MRKKRGMLELVAQVRTHKALDRAARKNSYYRTTQKEQDKAFNELKKAGLSKYQEHIVDRVFCSLTASGAAYGEAAYRLGLHDGIRLMSEVNEL